MPSGDDALHAGHERGGEINQPRKVTGRPQPPAPLRIDARDHHLVQHKDKNGRTGSEPRVTTWEGR